MVPLRATCTPVASKLRLLTALLHIDLHLERVGDQAVNLAKITMAANGLPQNPTLLQDLAQMGAVALRMMGAAMEALAGRDLALARQLPRLDDPSDALNRGMLAKVLAGSDDQGMLEWGVRMYVASRQLERIGDNVVDIGEQVAFLVTGQFREYTDASHPEVEHPPSWLNSDTSPKRNSVSDVNGQLGPWSTARRVALVADPPGALRVSRPVQDPASLAAARVSAGAGMNVAQQMGGVHLSAARHAIG